MCWNVSLSCFTFSPGIFIYTSPSDLVSAANSFTEKRQKLSLLLSKWTNSTLESANGEVTDFKRTRFYNAVVLSVDKRPREKACDDPCCLVPINHGSYT